MCGITNAPLRQSVRKERRFRIDINLRRNGSHRNGKAIRKQGAELRDFR